MNVLIPMFDQNRVLKYSSGEEKMLYRRTSLGEPEYIYVYFGYPLHKVLCALKVEEIISGDPFEVWNKTKEFTSLSYNDFLIYFYDKKSPAYAYKVKSILYEKPKPLSEFGVDFIKPGFINVPQTVLS